MSAGNVGAALLGLSPGEKETLQGLLGQLTPQGLLLGGPQPAGLLRRLFASLRPRQLGRAAIFTAAIWFVAQWCLRSRSTHAQAFVTGICNHIVKPALRWPATTLGFPEAADNMVNRFLANNNRARELAERGLIHSVPLLLAAWSLHRRLRQILDHSHAFKERKAAIKQQCGTRTTLDLTNRHFRAQCELMFLLAEFFGWVEEVRRHSYTLGMAGHCELERGLRLVESAFAAELPPDSTFDPGDPDEEGEEGAEQEEEAVQGSQLLRRAWLQLQALWLQWCCQCSMCLSAASRTSWAATALASWSARPTSVTTPTAIAQCTRRMVAARMPTPTTTRGGRGAP